LVGVMGMIFYKMIYSYNISKGKRWVNLLFLGLAALVNVAGNLFAIPKFGIWGAGIVSITSYMLCGICFLIYFWRVSHISLVRLLFVQRADIEMVKKFFSAKDVKKKSAVLQKSDEGGVDAETTVAIGDTDKSENDGSLGEQ